MADLIRAFVTGWPVDHSRSPLIHGFWLEQLGIKGDYVKHPCTVEKFEAFLTDLAKNGFVGGNVTIPHKEAAFHLCEKLDEAAKRMGAVNTVWLEGPTICGSNTDGYGFLANLDEQAPGWDQPSNQQRGALVIGAGGASRAVIDSLISRNFHTVTIANRTVGKARELASQFGYSARSSRINEWDEVSRNVAVIVNTTSVGMNENRSPIDLADFDNATVVNDIIYTPLETTLLRQARKLGMKPVDGLGMLLHQAVPGFEKWFGKRPEVTKELRDLVIASLDNTA